MIRSVPPVSQSGAQAGSFLAIGLKIRRVFNLPLSNLLKSDLVSIVVPPNTQKITFQGKEGYEGKGRYIISCVQNHIDIDAIKYLHSLLYHWNIVVSV